MENKFFKALGFILLMVLLRSFYFQFDFYYQIWKENPITVIFLGLLFGILILMAVKFQEFENADSD